VQVAPILRFFPADHFMLGPNISWTGMFADGDNVNQFGMGLDIGAVFDLNENYYYLRSGGSLAVVGGKGMNSSSGFSLPICRWNNNTNRKDVGFSDRAGNYDNLD
jgi:hypothetical protein